MNRPEALRIYNHLLSCSGLSTASTAAEKLACQRTVYRIYNEEVDGYKRYSDTGFENGTLPKSLKED